MNNERGRSAFAIPGAEQWELTSQAGDDYRIMVWTPETAVPEDGFPIIYMLDANAAFGTMAETVRLLSMGPYRIEPSIVVGIGYNIDQPLHTERRFYDYTVYASEDELPPRKDKSPWPLTGGAEHFLQFIEQELKPLIEQTYTVNRSRQMLFGHSLGGLFALYTLFMKGEAFQFYVAGSPSIWWKNEHIVPYTEQLIAEAQRSPLHSSLFIGVGSLEKPHMVRDARLMYERLSAADIPGFSVQYRCFEDEGHLSIVTPLIGRAIRFADQGNQV
ncbi:alpha/beta hydrolase [Brevibacillus daliensis]|uniref:alpha/beta hydrolase n=1 Tax=Brevibacillus daliensis TaxID=2892995 RepID=UPI001E45CFDC|nr:alpha/beta hydrolase-fold protein [Brevibacillus daliensis]